MTCTGTKIHGVYCENSVAGLGGKIGYLYFECSPNFLPSIVKSVVKPVDKPVVDPAVKLVDKQSGEPMDKQQ